MSKLGVLLLPPFFLLAKWSRLAKIESWKRNPIRVFFTNCTSRLPFCEFIVAKIVMKFNYYLISNTGYVKNGCVHVVTQVYCDLVLKVFTTWNFELLLLENVNILYFEKQVKLI